MATAFVEFETNVPHIKDNVPVKSNLQPLPPPLGKPRAFEILENFCSNSPLTGPKNCLNAPTPAKITRLLF